MPQQRLSTGIDLHYESHGAGEPLVLIPGTGFAGNVWYPSQVPSLSKSLRVITLDVRGCGRSSAPEGVYTIEQMACDVAAECDAPSSGEQIQDIVADAYRASPDIIARLRKIYASRL
jgi:pimeloyl-ACP methyl ester carboxylesterase